jgi:prepilin-type N-terminal cleavage/methylation domain-containing protein
MLPPSRQSRSGFTLVEVMMATVILVVGFMGMIEAITIGSELLAAAERQTLAHQIINHDLDRVRQSTWSSLSAGTSNPSIGTQFTNAINAAGGAANWTLTRTITNINPNGTTMRMITVTVTWTKSGTMAAASTATGSALDKLAYFRHGPIQRTYTRSETIFLGPTGLILTVQRI